MQLCIFPLGRSRYLTVSGAAYVAARTTERSVERVACGVPLLPASIALQPRESRSPATSCAPLQRPSDLFIAGEPSFMQLLRTTRPSAPATNCRSEAAFETRLFARSHVR